MKNLINAVAFNQINSVLLQLTLHLFFRDLSEISRGGGGGVGILNLGSEMR